MKIVVTGGGTGGHIYPALSIADRLMEKHPNSEVLYIGAKGGVEEKIVPEYGYNLKTIGIKGFLRKINLENVKRVLMVKKALGESKRILKEFSPDIIIGTGGYVCGPVVMAGNKLGILTAIHEQNAFPGITNKLLSKRSDIIFLGFEESKNRFKTKKDIIYVGNPVRDNIFSKDKMECRRELGFPQDKKMILIVGGSGGQKSLNDSFLALYDHFVEKDYAFINVTGKRYFLDVEFETKDKPRKDYQIIKDYEFDMPKVMMAADLIICSAGASTIAEINAMGKASIVIPKAYTAENHQEYNAKIISENGAGRHILESELVPEKLGDMIDEILENQQLRISMEEASRALYPSDPIERMIGEIEKRLEK
ncbi:MAG: undecaprenyldiphospho-muramoylpentapeptide beta-N-acetylglucosaminyltransferase [Filifactoraceae bacterium]